MALAPSDAGWSAPTLPECRDRVTEVMQSEIAVDVPLTPSSAYGRIRETLAVLYWLALSGAHRVYLDGYARTASGVALGQRLGLIGFARLPQAAATGTVAFFGDSALTTVPAGTSITNTETGRTAETDSAVNLSAGALRGVLVDDDGDGLYRITIDGENQDFTASSNTVFEIAAGLEAAAASNTKGAFVRTYAAAGVGANGPWWLIVAMPSALTVSVTSPASGLTLKVAGQAPCTETSVVEGLLPISMDAVPAVSGVDIAVQLGSFEPSTGIEIPGIPGGTAGRLTETDAAYRVRYLGAVGADAANAPRMTLALAQVPDVTYVQVYENETDTTDGDGRPGHSVEAVVLGGAAANIRPVIAANLAAGIQAYGDGSVSTVAIDGKSITFTRPTEVFLWVDIVATSGEGYDATGDPQQAMADAILEYLTDPGSTGYLRPGLDVYLSRIASAAVASVAGIDTIVVELDLTATPAGPPTLTAANQVVGVREVAIAAAARITVAIT